MSSLRKQLLLGLFSVDRIKRVRLHAWVADDTGSGGSGDAVTVHEMFQSATDAVWGDGAFGGQRTKLWQNWDVMMFWLELLQASIIMQ